MWQFLSTSVPFLITHHCPLLSSLSYPDTHTHTSSDARAHKNTRTHTAHLFTHYFAFKWRVNAAPSEPRVRCLSSANPPHTSVQVHHTTPALIKRPVKSSYKAKQNWKIKKTKTKTKKPAENNNYSTHQTHAQICAQKGGGLRSRSLLDLILLHNNKWNYRRVTWLQRRPLGPGSRVCELR